MADDVSATPAQQAAVVAVLRGDVPVRDYLHENPPSAPDAFGRVFDVGTVPAGIVGRWITVGDVSEGWRRAFNVGSGSACAFTIHLWHRPAPGDERGKAVTLTLWGLVARVLSNRVLTLADGHQQLSGHAQLIAVALDPDGETYHGVVRYDALTRRVS